MECLSQAWSIVPCLWECSAKHAAYIGDLEDNLTSLRSAMLKLNNLSEDVRNRVREAEEQQMKRRNQVNGWLESVEGMEKEVDETLHKGREELGKKCVGSCCPKNCKSSYKLGKKVMNMIPQVATLTEEGKFDVVADPLPPPPVDELPMDNVVVGFESKFEEVWFSLQSKDSTVIGLVGMGGAGKTTLLKQLNNKFLEATHEYELVIWIVVSKPANLGRIQDTIRRKLNISDHLWEDKTENERVLLIFNKLKIKRFVVMLDDIWERLRLSDVGIPQPSRTNMSKVVFTTRSREVYRSMDANKIVEVGCLPPDQAYCLFCSKVGEDMLKSRPEINGLVKDVARECQGLPLALITIGRAMSGKTDAQQWRDAKRALEKYPSTFPGMESQVFSKLVFSYDSLATPTLKKCFEYCSLYPEDYNIAEKEIIELWLAEGLIDDYDTMYDAIVQGRQIIESLMHACLLEAGERVSLWNDGEMEETVKMHDVIRDMAIWVACERGEKKNKFLVDVVSGDHDATIAAPNAMAKWRTNAEKVSLWGSGTSVESLKALSSCSNLATLIIRDTELNEISGEVFHSKEVLKVLNLSNNRSLEVLPAEIGGLANLEYLGMIWTHVKRLPVEVDQLKRLKFLILDEMIIIPKGIISSLWSLQAFEQHVIIRDYISVPDERLSMEMHMLQELEGLKQIMDIRLVLKSASRVQTLLNSPKLQSCTSGLTLTQNDESFPVVLDLGAGTLTKHLERLQMDYCHMSEIKLGRPSLGNNLHEVLFMCCGSIRNVSSLVYVPNLCILEVSHCSSIEELIGEDVKETCSGMGVSLFSRLESLTLVYLPWLRSICPQSALPFPSLKLMRVRSCESVIKLPLDSDSAASSPPELKIKGERDWWDSLQWDSQATMEAFTPKFRLIGG